jgi:hypothetical protein
MTTSEEGSRLNAKIRVCEMCLQAGSEEAMAPKDECELLCVMFGDEIGDHLCEEIENDGATRCSCTCHESAKQALRGEGDAEGGVG